MLQDDIIYPIIPYLTGIFHINQSEYIFPMSMNSSILNAPAAQFQTKYLHLHCHTRLQHGYSIHLELWWEQERDKNQIWPNYHPLPTHPTTSAHLPIHKPTNPPSQHPHNQLLSLGAQIWIMNPKWTMMRAPAPLKLKESLCISINLYLLFNFGSTIWLIKCWIRSQKTTHTEQLVQKQNNIKTKGLLTAW